MTFLEHREIFKFTVCVLKTSYHSLLHYYKREIVTKVKKNKREKGMEENSDTNWPFS